MPATRIFIQIQIQPPDLCPYLEADCLVHFLYIVLIGLISGFRLDGLVLHPPPHMTYCY